MFINRRLIIILISIIGLFVIVGLTLGERGSPTWPEKFVKDTTSFFQRLLYKPANAIAGFFEDVQNIYYLYEENKVLKATLNQYAQLQANYQVILKENQRLREMVGAKSSLHDYSLRFAEVIARNHDSWYNLLTIDKGERDGIKPNTAVITPSGLIGVVQNVSYFSANVRLLTDVERGSHVSAKIISEKQDVYGIIESYDTKRKELILRKVPLESPLEAGQKVVTSGLGGVFPPDILIGEITEVLPGEYGLTKMAYVKPAADLYQIDEVFVVDDVGASTEEAIDSTEPDGDEALEGVNP